MFEGYGVGLTLTELGRVPGEWPVPAGVVARPSRLHEVLTVSSRSDAEIAVELGRVQGLKAMLAAYEAALVVGLAAHRPDALDPAPGQPGRGGSAEGPIPGTSEFFVDELALVTNATVRAAATSARDAQALTGRLSGVWAALADGVLDVPRARVFIDVLATTAAGVAEAVAPRVLPAAVGLSLGRLRARLTREVLAVDAAAAERRRLEAEKRADVRVYPTANGMSELAAELPSPLAAACWSTVDELAWMVKNDGDPRPIGQLRAGVLADLLLRPWDTSRPAVTANLTVVAPLAALTGEGEDPAEAAGQPITAAHVRELLARLDAVCPGGLQAPTGGSLQVAVTDADGVLLATTTRPELQRIARRGCPAHADRPARADRASLGRADQTAGHDGGRTAVPSAGHLADPPAPECSCAVLDRPAAVGRYTPNPAQRRFVQLRDQTCRHPGCRMPVGRVDLDHVHAYGDGGSTDCDNLCCLCRRHHRLKTHAPGWRFVLTEHGVLRVTTPSGITRTTRPPGLADRIEQRALPAPPRPPAEPPPF